MKECVKEKKQNTFSSKFSLSDSWWEEWDVCKNLEEKIELWQPFKATKVKLCLQKLLLSGNVFESGHLEVLYFVTILDMIVSYF